MKRNRLIILLVEDNEHDAFFVQKATERAGSEHVVRTTRDGEEAIAYLRGDGKYADREKFPVPNVMLTDLKMPGMNGFGLLKWLQQNKDVTVIPTIVFSSSNLDNDVRLAYELGASSFIMKPSRLDAMVDLLKSIYDYWSRCECPRPGFTSPAERHP